MAQRRMFSKKITDTDKFIDMPLSAQALYFHLNMGADDEGFIDRVRSIRRTIGASEDDLKLLIAKQFIIPFESGIVVIKDWRIHNYIQSDRFQATTYQDEKKMLTMNQSKSFELKGLDEAPKKMDTKCIQSASSGKVRLGKLRLEKELYNLGNDQADLVTWEDVIFPPYLKPKTIDQIKKGSIKNAIERTVIEYLNQELGSRYSHSDTNKKLVSARLKNGHTLEDFKMVIDSKIKEWSGNPDLQKYLRPQTLFGNKFEGYLNTANIKPKSNTPEWADTQYRTEATAEELAELEKLKQEMKGQ